MSVAKKTIEEREKTGIGKRAGELGSFGGEVRFWRNNGFVFGFESGSFLVDNRSREIVSDFKLMSCDFYLLRNWLRLYKKHFFLKRGSLI
jgi:hypothetical protein